MEIGDCVWFKSGNGVFKGFVKRINKRSITIDFSHMNRQFRVCELKDNNKMVNGIIKGINEYHTLYSIGVKEYSQILDEIEVSKEFRAIFHFTGPFTTDQRKRMTAIAKERKR